MGRIFNLRNAAYAAPVAAGGLIALKNLHKSAMDQGQIRNAKILADLETSKDQARSNQIASLLEQARMQKSLAENTRRLAQSAPDLYSSVMAGQRLPKGSVVLGGRPREDLMRQLAASMDSGRFRKQDPLSELMG